MLLGEEILPTGLGGSTSKMCRIKHSEHYIVSTKSYTDEEIENMSFANLKDMSAKLEVLAETEDEKIGYVDIYMPVPLLHVRIFEKKKSLNC